MNKLKGYKFIKKKMTPSLDSVCRVRGVTMRAATSAMQARRVMRKGCEPFLSVILDFKRGQVDVEKIPVVREFLDVFPEELPSIPLEREVDLSIEIVRGTTPMSKAPYRMPPTELKELKSQLQELMDKGFIRPSVSPWVHLFYS